MSTPTPVPANPGQEIQNLFTQYGELTFQLEQAQFRRNLVAQRLNTLLNVGQPTA